MQYPITDMSRHSEAARHAAHTALELNNHDVDAAAEMFHSWPAFQHVQQPKRFVAAIEKNLQDHGTTGEAPRAGRPAKMTDEQAKTFAKLIADGHVTADGRHLYYTSFEEAIHDHVDDHPEMKHIWDSMAHATFIRHVKHALCNLEYVSIIFKPQFTDLQRQERLQLAMKLLHAPVSMLMRMVFIDAKKLRCRPESSLHVWRNRETAQHGDTTREDVRMSQLGCDYLNWYIAVSPRFGPLAICFVTGTSGQAVSYTVSQSWYLLTPKWCIK